MFFLDYLRPALERLSSILSLLKISSDSGATIVYFDNIFNLLTLLVVYSCFPPKTHVEVLTIVFVNVTLFGNKCLEIQSKLI